MGEHRFSDAITYAQRALALGSGDLSPLPLWGTPTPIWANTNDLP